MKTSAFLIFASILLVFAYMATLRIPLEEEGEVTKILPKTVLLYLEQRDGADALQRFAASRLGRQLQAIDFNAVAHEIGVPDESINFMKEFWKLYEVAKDDPILCKVFGKKAAVVLMQPLDSAYPPDVMGFLQENTIIAAQPEDLKHFAETEENFERKQLQIVSSSQYGTHRILRIVLNNQNFSLVTLKSWVIMSRNEKHVRRCIDTFDGELPALATDPDFQEIRKQSSEPDSFLFVPMNTVRQFITSLGEGFSFPAKDLLLKELQSTAGFNGFGYAAWRKEKKIKKKILIRFARDEVNNFARNYVDTTPVESSMLSLATKEPMIYYWSNTLNFKNFAMYIHDAAQHDPRLAEFLDRLKTITGKDASATFALFGKEASMIVEQGPQDVLFPFPLGIFFLRVEKVEELKDILDKLLQTYNPPLKEEEYKSAWFRYWSRGPQDGLLPLYGFWQDLFFFGNSTTLLRRVIDTNNKHISLADIATIRPIDPGVKERNNSVTYLNNAELITTVKNFLEVLGTFVAIEDREIAMKVRLVLKTVVNPLLDGAMMYRASTSRSYITDDMLTIDSITDISDTLNTAKE